MEEPGNERLVSPASYWEMAIKISLGKYVLSKPYADFMDRAITHNGFAVLPIEPRHTAALIAMPFHHRDPFDRMIIAQAMVENITVVSSDAQFDAYPVKRIW